MAFELTREAFILKAGYTEEEWTKSSLDWEQLLSIAKHHDAAQQTLTLHAGAIANRIQAFNKVHSVRWRVKDTYGLLKKILRKNLEPDVKKKWKEITVENYRSAVSDLIGVRALHLLIEDCIEVDEQIREVWNAHDITIFKRDGDSSLSEIIERGAIEEPHNYGYRSIHYGIKYQPEKEPILVEIQVRTIFQEGWSEIDHKVKYPDFSENEYLTSFLRVFNGLAGTADEMGSFVIKLDNLIKTQSAAAIQNEVALAARDAEVEKLQKEIDKLRKNDKIPKTSIQSMQKSVDTIKEKNNSINIASWINSFGLDHNKSLSDYLNRNKKDINTPLEVYEYTVRELAKNLKNTNTESLKSLNETQLTPLNISNFLTSQAAISPQNSELTQRIKDLKPVASSEIAPKKAAGENSDKSQPSPTSKTDNRNEQP